MTRYLAALALTALALAGTAAAAPSEQLDFSTTVPDMLTGVHARIDYGSTNAEGQQRALRRHLLTYPPGTRYDSLGAGDCRATSEEVRSQGLGACPADSKVGEGTLRAVPTTPPASAAGPLTTDLTIFNTRYPKEKPTAPNAVIVVVSVAGGVRAAFVAAVEGNVLVEEPPPTCATPGEQPPGPNGEITVRSVDYRIAERSRTVDGQRHDLLTTPASCPSSDRWTFNSQMDYRDGTVGRASATTMCAQNAGQRLSLRVSPRTVGRCRAQRFSFSVTSGGQPVPNVAVRFANRRAVTGADGRAVLAARLCRAGERRATAKADGLRKGVATVSVLP